MRTDKAILLRLNIQNRHGNPSQLLAHIALQYLEETCGQHFRPHLGLYPANRRSQPLRRISASQDAVDREIRRGKTEEDRTQQTARSAEPSTDGARCETRTEHDALQILWLCSGESNRERSGIGLGDHHKGRVLRRKEFE